MHELSVAYHLVEIAADAAQHAGAQRVAAVHLRLGALAGVERESLLFSYEIAAAGTRLEGSRLEIEDVPAAIYCPTCDTVSRLDTIQLFRCPICSQLSGDVRQGRELEIVSLELLEGADEPQHEPSSNS